ncbi:MAG TPA: DUF1217 domain-containing protein [Acidiphilium sp.]|nr:MAG: hypothetical protein B7Z67_01000 [Acidiphilium sp. 21-60-14]OYV90615.1 MAG: hypothetical protein B7Z57_08330 [Acidiphilium sp. 37-60-79]HQT88106.1 DUF1217 domain-containing protein [Acidiphilium sp.]HQU24036.1 DUF1217 domain-containing protein [Acidiphilium sp.]
MSASLSGVASNFSSLFAVQGASNSSPAAAISAILVASISGTVANNGASAINPITALSIAQHNQTTDITNEAKQPQVLRDITAFTAAVKNAKTPQELLQNPTVLKVLLTASGLGSQVGYPALAQKALLSDPSKSNSLAQQLSGSNAQWLSAAETYNFATKGLSVIQNPKVISTISNGYAEVLWRQSLDAQTPGLSNALDFIQNAKTFTSATQILGDSVMRTVVTTALGLPPQIAYQDVNTQASAITNRLDISNFQKPSFVQSFADRYLAIVQSQAQSQPSNSGSSIASLAAQSMGLLA